jgi:putative peptidoglycan lipid II flippase
MATQRAVVAYSVGLIGLIVVKVLAPGFYARQDIRTPVRMALVALAATQVMNLIFVWPLRHAGLALAIGLGACCNAVLLYRGLRRRSIYSPQPGWAGFLLKLGLAVLAMSAVLWLATGAAEGWLAADAATRAARLAGVIALGAATYFAALWLAGFRLADFSKRV